MAPIRGENTSLDPRRPEKPWYPQADSNRCFHLERVASWSPRRWGRSALRGYQRPHPQSYGHPDCARRGGHRRAQPAPPRPAHVEWAARQEKENGPARSAERGREPVPQGLLARYRATGMAPSGCAYIGTPLPSGAAAMGGWPFPLGTAACMGCCAAGACMGAAIGGGAIGGATGAGGAIGGAGAAAMGWAGAAAMGWAGAAAMGWAGAAAMGWAGAAAMGWAGAAAMGWAGAAMGSGCAAGAGATGGTHACGVSAASRARASSRRRHHRNTATAAAAITVAKTRPPPPRRPPGMFKDLTCFFPLTIACLDSTRRPEGSGLRNIVPEGRRAQSTTRYATQKLDGSTRVLAPVRTLPQHYAPPRSTALQECST